MLTANQGAIGLRSKVRRALSRKLVIQSGSPFHQEISRTTSSLIPFLGRERIVDGVAPTELVPTEVEVGGGHAGSFADAGGRENFPYVDSNKPGPGTVPGADSPVPARTRR